MSSSYGRLATIRDYWMPRNIDARVEVRVTDIDETLREQVRLSTLAADRLVENLRLREALEVIAQHGNDPDSRLARAALENTNAK